MKDYRVEFTIRGTSKSTKVRANDAAEAKAKAKRDYPSGSGFSAVELSDKPTFERRKPKGAKNHPLFKW